MKMNYESPTIEVDSIEVEYGYAVSASLGDVTDEGNAFGDIIPLLGN